MSRAPAVDELHRSLMASLAAARRSLRITEDIERQHGHTRLPDLVALVKAGALPRPGHHLDDELQR